MTTDIEKVIKKATSGFIGQQNNETTKKILRSLISDSLSKLLDKNILKSYYINYSETRHNRKKFFGKVLDWVKWKSPLYRFFYKPKYVEIEIVDIFHRFWDNGSLDISEEEFDKICGTFAGIKTWEERYPQNPYVIMDISINIIPSKPVEYVKTDIILEKEMT